MRTSLSAVAALIMALALATPAAAQQCMCGRPPERNVYAGLLATDFTPDDASASFNPASLSGAKVAVIASANFNEYSRRWNHWYGEGNIENYWAYRSNRLTRDDIRGYEQNTDPRAFADQLITLIEPHVGEVFSAPDLQQAREQGATYYLVADAWFGTTNAMNTGFKTWAGVYLLDSSLQLVFSANADGSAGRSMLVLDVIAEDARASRRAYERGTQPVLDAFRARLGEPPAPIAPVSVPAGEAAAPAQPQ
jgi:hypothetical protein